MSRVRCALVRVQDVDQQAMKHYEQAYVDYLLCRYSVRSFCRCSTIPRLHQRVMTSQIETFTILMPANNMTKIIPLYFLI